jgi:hypothetical protein
VRSQHACIDDIHRGIRTAERRAQQWHRLTCAIEDAARLFLERVIEDADTLELWMVQLELAEGAPELPGVEYAVMCENSIALFFQEIHQ